MADKPAGFMFNVEKFFGSVAVQRMSFTEKGVYLVMLFQQWRAKTRNLPDHPTAVADLIAVTPSQTAEVEAAWDVVRRKFVTSQRDQNLIYNVEIERTRRKQRAYFREQRERGVRGGISSGVKRRQQRDLRAEQNEAAVRFVRTKTNDVEQNEAIRSDLIRSDLSRPDLKEQKKNAQPPDARSKRPIYTSDRFAVFEWQLDELGRMLGPHTDRFDLHAFFDALSQQSRDGGLVIPRADAWGWLQAQVLAEARRRGLPIATVEPSAPTNKRIAGLIKGGEAFLSMNQGNVTRAKGAF